ncbi:MAG: sugar ABC transporter ATP-binding protein [Saprospiraceae bacterium]
MTSTNLKLRLSNISKRFGKVIALQDVSLEVQKGEVHALCGENGAGKSTLMNIIAGNLQPDTGEILLEVNGNFTTHIIKNPAEAQVKGIGIVHQELSLVNDLTVAENIFANRLPVNKFGWVNEKQLFTQTQALLQILKITSISPNTPVRQLSAAQKQMVEIAKALSLQPSLLILDEPTASLTDHETEILFTIIQQLKSQGVTIIYISHRLAEIFRIADRITVLKDGQFQKTLYAAQTNSDELIQLMVGRDIKQADYQAAIQAEILLQVKNLSNKKIKNITFQVNKGEIVALTGLVGSGRTEIARAIFGADRVENGQIILDNVNITPRHPAEAIRYGIAYLTEDRKENGLFLDMDIMENVISAAPEKAYMKTGFQVNKAAQIAEDYKAQLNIITPSVRQKVRNLSGGNQQKVVIAKWLLTDPKLLIADEPTHGVDVGAKFEIYKLLRQMAQQGTGILLISSELPEVLHLADRIIIRVASM